MTTIRDNKLETVILLVILTLLALSQMGCTLFGTSNAPDLTNKLATDLRQTRKEVNDVNKSYENVSGQIHEITQRIEYNQTAISTITSTVSNISTNETPFWLILLPIIVAWVIVRIVNAKLDSGHTLKNLLRGI